MRFFSELVLLSLAWSAPTMAQTAQPSALPAHFMAASVTPETEAMRDISANLPSTNRSRPTSLLPGSVAISRLTTPAHTPESLAPVARTMSATPTVNTAKSIKRISLNVVKVDRENFQLDKMRVISGRGTLTQASTGSTILELQHSGVTVVSSSEAKAVAAHSPLETRKKTPLPWIVLDEDPDESDNPDAVRATRPFLQLAQAVQWDAAQHQHIAEFWFGLDPEQGRAGPLSNPIFVLFAATCGEVSPSDKVSVESSGIAGYAKVRVACSPSEKNARSPQMLSLHLDDGQLEYPFEIPKRRGTPSLVASTTAAEGLGLSTVDLTVSHREEDGTLLAVTEPLMVSLTTDNGELDITHVTIAQGASEATLRVRPRGLGIVKVTAQVAGMRSKPVEIDLDWPGLAASAALVGGGTGGGLAARKRRRTGPLSLMRRVVEGSVVGLVITALSLVLPDFSALGTGLRSSEIALFVLAALGGFAGCRLIDRATHVLFPALRRAPPIDKSPA